MCMPELRLITARKPNLYLGNPSSGLIFYSFYSRGGNRSSGHSVGLKNYPLTSKSTAISQLYLCFTPRCSVFIGSREEPLTHKKRQTAAQCTDLWCPALENAPHMAWSKLFTDCLLHLLPILDLALPAACPSLIPLLRARQKMRDRFLHSDVEYRVKHN